MKSYLSRAVLTVLLGTGALVAHGAATPEEISQIGTVYTPWGAELQGNAAGTIPAYTGPLKPPPSYDPANPGYRPDPFSDEKPLFAITASNMGQYEDQLSEGVKVMLRKYPSFRLDVYPTHRTASYPDFYLKNAERNLTACSTINGGLGLSGCYGGTPFPFPKTGFEVMWNRFLKFDQFAFETARFAGTVVDTNGRRIVTGVASMQIQYPIFDPKRVDTPIGEKDIFEMLRNDFTEPARKNGEKIVVHDSIDMVGTGRRAWQYLPGQRRVKLSPDIAYDTPSPTGAGVTVTDELAVFYGAMDRYDFRLVGKKEMFIPYNTYRLHDQNICPDPVAETPHHMNPDCVRWELHRVWVVEATLKEGKRHVYPRRMLYLDEDLYGTGISDNFDATDKVYRVTMSLPFTLYESTGHVTDETVTYDLATGAYHRSQNATMGPGWVVTSGRPETFFSPQAMAGSGIR